MMSAGGSSKPSRRPAALELTRLTGAAREGAEVPAAWAQRVLGARSTRDASGFELLRRPEVSYEALLEIAGPAAGSPRRARR